MFGRRYRKSLKGGSRVWYFPDGYLPEKSSSGPLESHEALMLLNTNEKEAEVLLDFYFEDKPPVKDIRIPVKKESVKTLRLDYPEHIGGVVLPRLTQYSLRVRSDVPVVVQFGRLDATQTNLAYYGSMGYSEE